MKLINKIKDILFEEEEYTEPIKIRDEKNTIEEVKSIKIEKKEEKKESPVVKKEIKSERELFSANSTKNISFEEEMPKTPREVKPAVPKKENSFQFPDFDEEEFASSVSRVNNVNKVNNVKQNTNVLEYERKKNSEKRDYKRFDRPESRLEPKETEKKKFKPSPIISPVYGILNQDYKAEDIVDKKEDAFNINIEEVRKKAFEQKKEVTNVEKKNYDDDLDPVVTFFEDKDDLKKTKNFKTINSLLEEASEEISLNETFDDTLEMPKTNNLDTIEEELEKIEVKTKVKPKDIDDTLTIEDEDDEKDPLDETLDSDLYELIDSMYDEREEG